MIPPATKIQSTTYTDAAPTMTIGPLRVVEKGARIVHDRRKADDGRLERGAEPRRLVAELLHPVVVHAAGCRVRGEARAEMLRQHAAQGQRERHADEQRECPDAEQDGRRAVDAADAVEPGADGAHASAAHDSRQSCSHTIQAIDHFAAAAAPLGSSVFELFV